VGTVSTTSTADPNLENKLISAVTDTSISVLNTAISYSIYSPFFPPYFPPYFPPSFCVCGTCTWGGAYSCEGTLSYQYYTCGCAGCPGEGGYNPDYRHGICGYVDPCVGYVCSGEGCFKYFFTDVSANSADCPASTACYAAYGDCNCNCPATAAYRWYCGAC
jgi:hypothetical protein